jgi:hypothetical protein
MQIRTAEGLGVARLPTATLPQVEDGRMPAPIRLPINAAHIRKPSSARQQRPTQQLRDGV